MRRFVVVLCTLAVLGGLIACSGGSKLDNTGVPVFLTVDIEEYNPDINVCTNGGADLAILRMTISSSPKDPGTNLTSNQDVNLRDWDVSVERVDGGTVVSPDYHYEAHVFVAHGGSANLDNYRVYSGDYLEDAPFNYLFPENGGFDPETGATTIRETMNLVISGRTVSGKQIKTPTTPIAFRFYCN